MADTRAGWTVVGRVWPGLRTMKSCGDWMMHASMGRISMRMFPQGVASWAIA
ncbi:hypothetical protein ACGFW5_15980 [Streptomyces sp. NPDC048416]|uniref:hypothetical protein n=1 Tax=Streptomyces sp. NPDC048416 TaxID=3365546 RepID=UPI003713A66E